MLALGTTFPLLNDASRTGYAVSDLSTAGIGLAYGAPLLASMTAYSLRSWARFHRPFRSTRNGASILVTSSWPLLVGGPMVGCVAVLVSARTFPTDGAGWILLLTFLAVLECSAVLGVGLSWALPVVLSVPVAAVVCFFWINYLPATDSPALHQLTPMIDGFAATAQPATSAAVALLLISLTVVVGCLVLLGVTRWDRLHRLAAASLVVVLMAGAFGLGLASLSWTSRPLNLMAAEPRSTALECAHHGQLTICLWPENADRSIAVADVATALNDRLRLWGLPEVSTVATGHYRPGAATVDATNGTTRGDLLLSLAHGYLNQRVGCEVAPGEQSEAREAALVVAVAGDATLGELFDHRMLSDALEQLKQPPHQIGAWYDAGLAELRCAPSS